LQRREFANRISRIHGELLLQQVEELYARSI
jgi:hypothetical protein